jgi:hypothetical protein
VRLREVAGTYRSEEKRGALEVRGFQVHRFNPDNDREGLHAEAIWERYEATHIMSSIPLAGYFDCDHVLASLREELLCAASARLQ